MCYFMFRYFSFHNKNRYNFFSKRLRHLQLTWSLKRLSSLSFKLTLRLSDGSNGPAGTFKMIYNFPHKKKTENSANIWLFWHTYRKRSHIHKSHIFKTATYSQNFQFFFHKKNPLECTCRVNLTSLVGGGLMCNMAVLYGI